MQARTKKTFRDLWRQRTQVIAVGITIALGVMLYITAAGAFQNLTASYDATYDRLGFADLIATGGDPEQVAQAALDAGAAEAIARTQVDPPMLLEDTKLLGRVVGLPSDGRAPVDDVDVVEGDYLDPSAPDSILLESHAAGTFDLGPGDSLEIYTATGWHAVTVAGVADSAEYLWPARSRQDVLSDPHSFAVVFADEATVQEWFATGPTQTLALLGEGADEETVTAAMKDAGASAVTTQDQQPSQATLNEDLQGFDQMSVAFPALFLIAAGVAAWVLLTRRIIQERPVIGTMMAAGARRGRILRHYLAQGALIGLVGSVVGAILGAPLNSLATSAYTGVLGVPDTVVRNYPWMIAVGIAFGVLVGALGALGPAVVASRTAPAQAMRPIADASPPGAWSRLVARMTGVPVGLRMALRDLARSTRRTFATMLGTVLALVLVLASVGMMSSILEAIRIQFDEVELADATVTVQDASGAAGAIEAMEGVAAFEDVVAGEATILANEESYETALTGYEPGTAMHGFRGVDGETLSVPADGILVGHALQDLLSVDVGDAVTVSTAAGDSQTTIAGFVDEPMGTSAYASLDTASAMLPPTGVTSHSLLFTEDADRDAMRQAITDVDGVVAYQDSRAILSIVQQYLGLFYVFIGAMILLGAVLALAVMYVTMAVNVVERTGELATLRAAGVPLRRVAGAIATENMLATLLGVPIGLLLGVWAAQAFMDTFNDDLFSLTVRWSWWALPAAALGVLLAALASQWPASRQIARVDIARVVRERAS
ncbi:FtsX-like permease family protein [Demequina zhanjiangensis]|uniref:FtsX-like permease family protein n=1 Tax=Demequina zhanjiangensis TaxID=3051659 RepID=A0ABT8FZR2_9MICO|nr:FtsX-like permease family protein [Demequina sp. SYSU T00b26]MDN4472252.1 FtsX-like permease family protein [Demequina sp. SYSU T00b26]